MIVISFYRNGTVRPKCEAVQRGAIHRLKLFRRLAVEARSCRARIRKSARSWTLDKASAVSSPPQQQQSRTKTLSRRFVAFSLVTAASGTGRSGNGYEQRGQSTPPPPPRFAADTTRSVRVHGAPIRTLSLTAFEIVLGPRGVAYNTNDGRSGVSVSPTAHSRLRRRNLSSAPPC